MLSFPRFVFKDHGSAQRAGGSYSEKFVRNFDEYEDALTSGWYTTLPEAINPPVSVPAPVDISGSDDDAPPSRFELETEAIKRGIKIDRRMSDKRLAALIESTPVKEV